MERILEAAYTDIKEKQSSDHRIFLEVGVSYTFPPITNNPGPVTVKPILIAGHPHDPQEQ